MTLAVVSNPRAGKKIRLFANPGPLVAVNPRRRRTRGRRRGRRRNPNGTFAMANPVAVNPVRSNPKRRGRRRNPVALMNPRRRTYRRNPANLDRFLQGVGLEEVGGGIFGAFAAQETPALLKWNTTEEIVVTPATDTDPAVTVQVATYQNIGGTALGAVGAGFLAGFVSKGAGASAVVVGLSIAGLKLIGKVTGGKWGMLGGSPAMHLVTSGQTRNALMAPRASNGRGNMTRIGF